MKLGKKQYWLVRTDDGLYLVGEKKKPSFIDGSTNEFYPRYMPSEQVLPVSWFNLKPGQVRKVQMELVPEE